MRWVYIKGVDKQPYYLAHYVNLILMQTVFGIIICLELFTDTKYLGVTVENLF
jgi:hypothetical protein